MSDTGAIEEHLFHRQQWVGWNPDRPTLVLHPSDGIKEEPPFQVHKAEHVDCKCTCGAGDSGLPHLEGCGVFNRQSVGHDQFVTIIADGELFVLSGAWLAPLEG